MNENSSKSPGTKGWHRLLSWVLAAVLLLIVVYYATDAVIANSETPYHLIVYAFSTQEEVFTQGIFPAFEAAWKAEHGGNLTIEGEFGPSGTLAGKINLGAPADLVIFSNLEHADWIKFGGMVDQEFEPQVIGASPIVIIVRSGNPFKISGLADLAQPGLTLIHADPRSSGAGEWSLLAEYGNVLLSTGDPVMAQAQVDAIWQNVHLLAPSARDALTMFELGAGNALLTYEQDARMALERGVPLEIVVPERTVVARPVAVIVDKNVKRTEQQVVQAFLDFLLSDAGQQIFNQYDLRSTEQRQDNFPPLISPFTEDDLGGWSQAYAEIVETLWKTEIEPELKLEPVSFYLTSAR